MTRKDVNKVDPLVLGAVFNLPKSEAGHNVAKEVSTYSGDVMLVVLDKVSAPENIDQALIDATRRQWKQDVASREFAAVLEHMKTSADLYINPRTLQ